MTNETGRPQATNVVVWKRTDSTEITTKKVETVTDVYPCRLLEKGTNDDDVVVCGGTNPVVGVAGYEDTAKKWQPATRSTIYVANDQIAVVSGPGTGVILSIASGEAAVVGTLLKSAAAGQVAVGTAGNDHIIAKAKETVTGAAGTGSPIQAVLVGV